AASRSATTRCAARSRSRSGTSSSSSSRAARWRSPRCSRASCRSTGEARPWCSRAATSTPGCLPLRYRVAASDRRPQLSRCAPCDKSFGRGFVPSARDSDERVSEEAMPQAEVLSAPQTATSQGEVFPVPEALARASHCNVSRCQEMYRRSLDDPEGFWREQAKRLDWVKFPTRSKEGGYDDDVRIRWYEDGVLNASVNCIDRHLAKRGDQTAILWEGDDPAVDKKITY